MNLVIRPEYTITGEFLDFGLILHCARPTRYNHKIKKQFVGDVRLIARSFSQPVYAFQAWGDDPLKEKFILSLGFSFHHYRVRDTGEWAKLFIIHPLNVNPWLC